MKKDKEKQKKTHESTIGKIIYGFLLFLPLLAIGVTCGYAMFNKNAKDSFETTETIQDTQTNFSDMIVGEKYVFKTTDFIVFNPALSNISAMQINVKNLIFNSTKYDTATLNFIYYSSQNCIRLQIAGTQENMYSVNTIFNFQFEFNGSTSISNFAEYINQYLYHHEILSTTYISNVFYYSIDKVQQSPLFNWAENSIIYTGMNEFTTSLDIATPFIPLLLTYWLIISLVYFIYDIVLIIFNVLHRKIHELQDSI